MENKERQEAIKTVASMEEMGSTLMLIGLTCLFLELTITVGMAVPAFTLILGAGVIFATKIMRKLV